MPIEITHAPPRHGERGTNPRSLTDALWKGARCRCPRCGTGRLFQRYLSVASVCENCGEALHHQRADDAPPYVVMVIVGHVIVGLILTVEQTFAPPFWLHIALWIPATLLLSLLLLPPIKGALIALQWAFRMHGFGGEVPQPEPEPTPRHGD